MDRWSLTKDMRWYVADRLAEDMLPIVNAASVPAHPRNTFYTKYGKRLLDIAISFVALIVSLPINLVIAVVTYFDVGSPIFFRQVRTGKDGKDFPIWKFRNMRNTRDARGELLDPYLRVTKWGKFVRRTSLDELLNFWSVFVGDMSIIGPRPLVPEYLGRYSDRHRARLTVRPGLECPPRDLDGHVWTLQEQFENDVWYVENVSLKTDIMMFVNLVRFALDRKSTAARAGALRGTFMGYDADGNAIALDLVPQSYIDECERFVREEMTET